MNANLSRTRSSFFHWDMLYILIFLMACYFPLFLHLDSLAMKNFDEARVATSTLEMYQNQQWLVPHFDGKPDNWSVKPPFLLWFQVLFVYILGPGELAVRLPSALAALGLILTIVAFCKKYLSNLTLGIVCGLVLLTSHGFIDEHISRTADYDAPLAFLNFLAALSFFLFIESTDKNAQKKWILLTGVFIGLAVLTKSVMGFLLIPGMFLYLLWRKKLLFTLQFRFFYIAMTVSLLIILSYYLAREWVTPGYLDLVWQEEWGGRYFKQKSPDHNHEFWFYFKMLYFQNFFPWILLLPLSIYILIQQNNPLRNLGVFSIILSVSYLTILTFGKVKIEWYLASAYPFLAIWAGIGVYGFLKLIPNTSHSYTYLLSRLLFFVLIFGLPYYSMVDKALHTQETNSKNLYGQYLRWFDVNNKLILSDVDYNAHIKFYSQLYKMKGFPVENKLHWELAVGDTTMYCGKKMEKQLSKTFEVEVIRSDHKQCKIVVIKRKVKD